VRGEKGEKYKQRPVVRDEKESDSKEERKNEEGHWC
jgi:hypothetical protein